MIRVSSLEDSVAFLRCSACSRSAAVRTKRAAAPTCSSLPRPNEAAPLELTYNWGPEPYTADRNSGHLAYAVDKVYEPATPSSPAA